VAGDLTVLALRDAQDAGRAAAAVRQHLAAGGIIAYPTETVYGLGTALAPAALQFLAAAKSREAAKPFILLASAPLALPGLSWTAAARLLAGRFWPGPLTLAVAADERYLPPIRSAAGTVAVRATPLAALHALLQLLGQPITSTSANLPGRAPATDLAELRAVVASLPQPERVLVLDGGSLPASSPSTVVDCAGERPRVLREGAVSRADLRSVLQPEGFDLDG